MSNFSLDYCIDEFMITAAAVIFGGERWTAMSIPCAFLNAGVRGN